MRCPCWIAVLCCLSTLSAAAPAAADGVSAGQIALGVAPSGGVALAIDLDDLAQELCIGGGMPDLRASADCSLTVNNSPTDLRVQRTSIGLWSGEAKAAGDGRVSVEVTPNALELAGTTLLSTPCGSWQYSLQLDPAAVQRPALLTLHPAVEHPAQGMFAGVIEVAAVLHLVPLDGHGQPDESAAIDLPFDFTFQLAGAWATSSAPRPSPKDSNLLLFAGFADGMWLSRRGCVWTIFHGRWCEACRLEAAPHVLETLNGKPS
jgi:hypothetical protein